MSARRKLMTLEERGKKVAEALASLQRSARSYAVATDDWAIEQGIASLATAGIRYAKAIERARDER